MQNLPIQESDPVVVTALAGITPLGDDAQQIYTALNASISAVEECDFYQCLDPDTPTEDSATLYAASIPLLDRDARGCERLYKLLELTLAKLKTGLAYLENKKAAIFIAFPAEGSGLQLEAFEDHLQLDLPENVVLKIVSGDQTEIFRIISKAKQYLQNGRLDCCIVGAVDSWIDAKRLEFLDTASLLKSQKNRDGFNPGEACCLMVLESQSHAELHERTVLAKIGRIGEGVEKNDYASGRQSSGTGLATAIRTVLGEDALHFDEVYCDLNGESYRAFEWGLMMSRLGPELDPLKALIHPAEGTGDVGVASGALLLLCASMAMQERDSADPILLWLAGRGANRAALSLFRGNCHGGNNQCK